MNDLVESSIGILTLKLKKIIEMYGKYTSILSDTKIILNKKKSKKLS